MRTEPAASAVADVEPVVDPMTAARSGTPPVPSLHVSRPRLVADLDRPGSAPLVLVSGPAGSGKTALVAEWLHAGASSTGPVGWVTFEDEDTRLWQPLLACLARLGLVLPEAAARPAPDLLLGRAHLQALAATIAGSAQRWTVVVDGYELRSPELAEEVTYLLDHTRGPAAAGVHGAGRSGAPALPLPARGHGSRRCGRPTWPSPTPRRPSCYGALRRGPRR